MPRRSHPRPARNGGTTASWRTVLLLALCGAGLALDGAGAASAPRELGTVGWQRDYDAAERRARREGRPLFVLFQEVPGCATCVGFGESVLSHPLLVEAIESEFVAVAIYNNGGAADRAVLRRFGEPAWNNPVVRFLDPDGEDLVERRDGLWHREAIAERMVLALRAARRPVPRYLDLLALGERTETATLSMVCFWTGEACLGGIDGVVATRPAWLGRREVVELRFDPTRVAYGALLRAARDRGCAERVFPHSDAQAREARAVFGRRAEAVSGRPRDARETDHKRRLARSPYRGLALSEAQAVKVNAALAAGEDPRLWLSPRQLAQVREGAPAQPSAASP